MSRRKWMLSGLALAAGVALAAFLAPWPQDEDLVAPETVALGQQVYGEHCASCHGATLEGETPEWRTRKDNGSLPAPPHDETGHTWHHPDQQLFAITKRGIAPFAPEGYVSDMPAFGDVLSDREIWAVLAYIKSTWPPETLRIQQERTAQAAKGG
ncbi:MAG: cytochrome c [Rhodospirillaceae bacterium]